MLGKPDQDEMPDGLPGHAKNWLWAGDDRRTRAQQYTKWDVKYRKLVKEHRERGDTSTPWLEFYRGTVDGQKNQWRARVRWEEDFSIAQKNLYYGDDGAELDLPLVVTRRRVEREYITSISDAIGRWQRKKEEREEDD